MTISPTTRASLLLRLRDPRDHEAWVEFVALYEPAVYRVLRRANLQDADTQEVMQDLFLAVHRNIDRWSARTWNGDRIQLWEDEDGGYTLLGRGGIRDC